jgi:hypothetical protein
VVIGNQKIVEHQFMHVGWGTHVDDILKFLKKYGVAVNVSS